MTDYVGDARRTKFMSGFNATQAAIDLCGPQRDNRDNPRIPPGRLTGLNREINEQLEHEAAAAGGPLAEARARHSVTGISCLVPWESMAAGMRRVQANQRATRALIAGVGSQGGFNVETELHAAVTALLANTTAFGLGAVGVPGVAGNFAIPTEPSAATAYWLAEDGSINSGNSSNLTFSQASGTPHGCGCYTEVSRQLLLQSRPSGIEDVVADQHLRLVALAVDAALLAGTGTAGQPAGILSQVPAANLITGTSFTLATAMSFATAIGNAVDSSCGWSANRAVAIILRQRAEASGSWRMLWEDDILSGECIGFPALSTNNLAASTMVFGAWRHLKIPIWGGGLEMEINPYANFTQGIVGIRTLAYVDCVLDYASAFAATSNFS